MSNKKYLKHFVRYDGSGKLIPGGNIRAPKAPRVGTWVEVNDNECCNPTTTTTTSSTTAAPVCATYFLSVERGGGVLTYTDCDSGPVEQAMSPYESLEFCALINTPVFAGDGIVFLVAMECLTTTTTTTTMAPGLRLSFNESNFPMSPATDVSLWNSFFDLPTNGTSFTSVELVDANTVVLFGGANIDLVVELFKYNADLLLFIDEVGCISSVGSQTFSETTSVTTISLPACTSVTSSNFYNCSSLTDIDLPSVTSLSSDFVGSPIENASMDVLTTVSTQLFWDNSSLQTLYLPLCTDLGGTTGNDDVFHNVTGRTVTLTVHSSLLTCNDGLPDGDICYLCDNNTVTVNGTPNYTCPTTTTTTTIPG